MVINDNLFAHLVTASPLAVPERIAEVLTRLCSDVPLPQPYYLGEADPPTVPWDPGTLATVIHKIVRPSCRWYHWQRGEEQEAGRVATGRPHLHSVLRIRAKATSSLVSSYVHFIREESTALDADLAFIHISNEDRPLSQDEPEYAMRLAARGETPFVHWNP